MFPEACVLILRIALNGSLSPDAGLGQSLHRSPLGSAGKEEKSLSLNHVSLSLSWEENSKSHSCYLEDHRC
jgi:hypothetical protein